MRDLKLCHLLGVPPEERRRWMNIVLVRTEGNRSNKMVRSRRCP